MKSEGCKRVERVDRAKIGIGLNFEEAGAVQNDFEFGCHGLQLGETRRGCDLVLENVKCGLA